MSLTEDQKIWFKAELEKKMKSYTINVPNTKKARATAVLKDPETMNDIMYAYEVAFKAKFNEGLKKDLDGYYKELIKNYFPREK